MFHSWLFGQDRFPPAYFLEDGVFPYFCDPSLNGPRGYTGSQIAFWADRTVGEFSGFACPDVEQTASGALPAETKYDTSGLRAARSGGPSSRRGGTARLPLQQPATQP